MSAPSREQSRPAAAAGTSAGGASGADSALDAELPSGLTGSSRSTRGPSRRASLSSTAGTATGDATPAAANGTLRFGSGGGSLTQRRPSSGSGSSTPQTSPATGTTEHEHVQHQHHHHHLVRTDTDASLLGMGERVSTMAPSDATAAAAAAAEAAAEAEAAATPRECIVCHGELPTVRFDCCSAPAHVHCAARWLRRVPKCPHCQREVHGEPDDRTPVQRTPTPTWEDEFGVDDGDYDDVDFSPSRRSTPAAATAARYADHVDPLVGAMGPDARATGNSYGDGGPADGDDDDEARDEIEARFREFRRQLRDQHRQRVASTAASASHSPAPGRSNPSPGTAAALLWSPHSGHESPQVAPQPGHLIPPQSATLAAASDGQLSATQSGTYGYDRPLNMRNPSTVSADLRADSSIGFGFGVDDGDSGGFPGYAPSAIPSGTFAPSGSASGFVGGMGPRQESDWQPTSGGRGGGGVQPASFAGSSSPADLAARAAANSHPHHHPRHRGGGGGGGVAIPLDGTLDPAQQPGGRSGVYTQPSFTPSSIGGNPLQSEHSLGMYAPDEDVGGAPGGPASDAASAFHLSRAATNGSMYGLPTPVPQHRAAVSPAAFDGDGFGSGGYRANRTGPAPTPIE